MKKMKSLLLLGICVLLVFPFGGCQSKTQSQQKSDEPPAETSVAKVDYDQFIGSYEDTYSQRAGMEVTKNPDGEGVLIHIHWGSSAWENTEWDMTGTLKDNKIVYSDCVKTNHLTEDNSSEEKIETEEISKEGYFDVDNGILKWTGSPEESCQSCAFEKYQ